MIELKYWKKLSVEQKNELKKLHNISVVTFSFIKKCYLESI